MLVGIDLGTTNSLIAYFDEGEPKLIPNRLGSFLTPSVVAIDDDNTVMVGEVAREYGLLHPLSVASTFKRAMGTDKQFELGNRVLRAEDLSSFVLRSLKEDAETHLGCPVVDAIISVPAYFNDLQRKATKRAGELAGLNVVRIINEPTAAAIAYGVASQGKDERCLVFDLGGGTFDVSILEFYGSIMEVHAIAGDNFLGGEDFTHELAMLFLKKVGVAPQDLDMKSMQDLMKEAERGKRLFGDQEVVTLRVSLNGEEVIRSISMMEYEDACSSLLNRLRKPIERSLRDADFSLAEVDRIVLVGGGTRLALVRSFINALFKRSLSWDVDPDTAIALGAALQCGMKERNEEIKEIILTDVCPYTLGTEVNFDNGSFSESGHYLPIIERNTVIPVSKTQRVCTAHDNQSQIVVRILQGESRLARNNVLLGELTVPVPPGPQGRESADITYTYDINSLLEVQVRILSTGLVRKAYVRSDGFEVDEEEAKERMERLAHLKQNPRDEEPNRLILLRGERLYEECFGQDRAVIDDALARFEHALDQRDVNQVNKLRKELTEIFDRIEYQ